METTENRFRHDAVTVRYLRPKVQENRPQIELERQSGEPARISARGTLMLGTCCFRIVGPFLGVSECFLREGQLS